MFIATEQGRPLGGLPDEGAISVVSLAELHLGVLVAADERTRARRLRTLAEVERAFDPLPVDADVARRFTEIVSQLRRRRRRPKVLDTLIAATAAALDLAVFTQDDDFDAIPGITVRKV